MLSLDKMSSGQQSYYTQLAREDYYLEGGEPPGQWRGLGAEALSLFGEVSPELLSELFQGRLDGEALVQNAGSPKRTPGWDLTFSAPKSVSVAWSQADRAVGNEIRAAHQEAVDRALGYLEERAAWTRRGRGGAELESCKLIFATYEHGTSRAQDPQLHTHALLMNAGVREDGSTGALDTRELYILKLTAGTLYRAELARQLEQRLGLLSVQDGTSFRLEAVPQELTEHFSTRRAQIIQKLKQQGSSGGVASERAALTTRTNKEHRPRAELMPEWQQTGQEMGFGREELASFIVSPRETPEEELTLKAKLRALMAFESLTERQTTFTEAQLTYQAAKLAQADCVGLDRVVQAVQDRLADPGIICLGRVDGQVRYTTQEIINLEENLLTRVRRLGELSAEGSLLEHHQEAALSARPSITDEQRDAVLYVTDSARRVAIVEGDAGTGKTFMLGAARSAWEAAGQRVIGAALSGKAADGLEEGAGIKSRTVASLLLRARWEEQRRGSRKEDPPGMRPFLDARTVLVVDEAGMVDTRQMDELTSLVAKSGAKLVLVGDQKQLQAIELGGSFAALGHELGSFRMSEVMRQQDQEHRESISQLARGEAVKALSYYAESGLLHVAEDRYGARDQLVSDWISSGGVDAPSDHLMLAARRVDVAALNREAQDARLAAGELQGDGEELGREVLFRGDRIVFTRNSRELGVTNGSFATVTRIHADTDGDLRVTAELDGSGTTVRFSTADYDSLQLGYASTTHKAQGMTTEHAYVLTDESMQDRELSYVQVSRARTATRIYSTEAEVGEGLAELARSFEKSRQKELAVLQMERAEEEELIRDQQSQRSQDQ